MPSRSVSTLECPSSELHNKQTTDSLRCLYGNICSPRFTIPASQLFKTQSSIMVFSIEDESTWRVTPENPVREVNGMDWERCAALHNLIIRLGWAVCGKPETEMPRETWWQTYITNPALETEWSARLSPTLKQFIRAAFEPPPDQSFFYYVNGLSCPEHLFTNCHEDEGIMCLYPAANPNMGSHPDGLK